MADSEVVSSSTAVVDDVKEDKSNSVSTSDATENKDPCPVKSSPLKTNGAAENNSEVSGSENVTSSPLKSNGTSENNSEVTGSENVKSSPTKTNGSPESNSEVTGSENVKSSPVKKNVSDEKATEVTGSENVTSSPMKNKVSDKKSSENAESCLTTTTSTSDEKSTEVAGSESKDKSSPMETNSAVEVVSATGSDKTKDSAMDTSTDKSTSEVNGKSPEKKVNVAEEANLLFAQGKREFAIKDFSAAVASLAKACELLATIHDEFSDELGDAYFYYGKALLDFARSESNVLGDKMEGKDDDDSDVEDGSEEGDEAGGTEENGDEAAASSELKTEDDKPEEGSEENADDLQLSWEILEMAKVIYQRRADDDKAVATKLSEVYLTLGENGLESERYDTAVSDFQTCLGIQKKTFNTDDRRIAETFYNLGIAHLMSESFDEAVDNFKESIAQLNLRLKTLETAKEKPESDNSIELEVTEINGAIKDINEKIADAVDHKKQLKNSIAKQMGLGEPSSSSNGASSSTAPDAFGSSTSSSTDNAEAKPISNITHLVRKKRKNEDEDADSSVDKKLKTDETAN